MLDLLSRRELPGSLLESVAEERLAAILEAGPGTGARAAFATASDWKDALRAVSADATALARKKLVIFPQASVDRYRVDFLVVVAPACDRGMGQTLSAFIVECDGRKGHAESYDQVLADRERETRIRRETGMDVLRFSGAEVLYRSGDVAAVIGAQVEAMAALRDHGDAVAREAFAVLHAVSSLSTHRALRADYTARNSERSRIEPYDPEDPFGEESIPRHVEREAEWDGFLALRMALARLWHAIAHARKAAPDREE